jgi:hypothetical protein
MKLELTQQEIQVIIMALGEAPLKMAGPVFTKIQEQVAHHKSAEEPQDHADREF